MDAPHARTGQEPTHSREYVGNWVRLYTADGAGMDFQRRLWTALYEKGTEFRKVDWDQSRALAKRYRTRMKECFDNCRKIALKNADYRYFEGFACPLVPCAHAWLVRGDGVVIEPTLCLQTEREFAEDYFGIHITTRELLRVHENDFDPAWVRPLVEMMEEKEPDVT